MNLEDEKNNSIVLDLESLNSKYNNLLTEYQQAVLNYINYLKQESPSDKKMVSIKGRSYWGTSELSTNRLNALQECKASCLNAKGCTGATYNSVTKICSLRNGDSNIVAGLPNNYAIISKEKKLLLIAQNINNQLTDINQQLQEKTENSKDLYDEQVQERRIKTKELKKQFNKLRKERNRINIKLDEYQTLDQKQTQGDIMINQNYYSYILLFCLAIVIIYLLYTFMGPSMQTNQQMGGKSDELFEINTILFLLFLGVIIVFNAANTK